MLTNIPGTSPTFKRSSVYNLPRETLATVFTLLPQADKLQARLAAQKWQQSFNLSLHISPEIALKINTANLFKKSTENPHHLQPAALTRLKNQVPNFAIDFRFTLEYIFQENICLVKEAFIQQILPRFIANQQIDKEISRILIDGIMYTGLAEEILKKSVYLQRICIDNLGMSPKQNLHFPPALQEIVFLKSKLTNARDCLGELPNLKALYLLATIFKEKNCLDNLPLSLEKLCLVLSHIKKINAPYPLVKLKTLELYYETNLSEDNLLLFLNSCINLEDLALTGCQRSSSQPLWHKLPKLKTLYLKQTDLKDEDFTHTFNNLESLELVDCPEVNSKFLSCLTPKNFPVLKKLDLSFNDNLTDLALAPEILQNLKVLIVDHDRESHDDYLEQITKIKQKYPNLIVRSLKAIKFSSLFLNRRNLHDLIK